MDDMMQKITGLLTLSEGILCRKEVLGKSFKAQIENKEVDIFFPQYPDIEGNDPVIGISAPLLPPLIAKKWKRGEEELLWGYPMHYPSGESCIELLAMSAECNTETVNDDADSLYGAIKRWEHAFVDYLKVETKQGTGRDKNIRRRSCTLELFSNEYIQENGIKELFGYIPNLKHFASCDNIERAIVFANTGKELKTEYQMLLSAYEARKSNQNRRSILDACAAVEIMLVNQITKYCQSIGLPSEVLLKKYLYLGDRFDLVKTLSTSFPREDYRTKIITPRNKVMHNKDVYPSDQTTDDLVKCVEVFLKHFHEAYF